jgi:hypothetical protein
MTSATIAVVQGAPGSVVDELFARFVERWSSSLRIAGILAEPHGIAERSCRAGFLRSIASGKRYSLFDKAGEMAEFCNLDGRGALAASVAAAEDIASGCDLVVLSKFAKMEEGGEGLCSAFLATIRAGIPLLTSVSPARSDTFASFPGAEFAVLSADEASIDAWLGSVRAVTVAS